MFSKVILRLPNISKEDVSITAGLHFWLRTLASSIYDAVYNSLYEKLALITFDSPQ